MNVVSQATPRPAELSQTESATGQPSLGRSWAALVIAVLQAVCFFSVAAARAGIVLGASSAVIAGWSGFFHRDIFRIPMLLLAIAGSAFNLFLLWNARRLRQTPAAAWRKRPLTQRERLRIGFVLCLSLLTLAMAATEIYFHRMLNHTFM